MTTSGMYLPVAKGLDLTPAPSATLKFHFPTATQSSDVSLQSSSEVAACTCATPARTNRRHLNNFAYIELFTCPGQSHPHRGLHTCRVGSGRGRRFVAVCNQV